MSTTEDLLKAVHAEQDARAKDPQYQALHRAWIKSQMKIIPGEEDKKQNADKSSQIKPR